MKKIITLLIFLAYQCSFAFVNPNVLACDSKVHFVISGHGHRKAYASGFHQIALKDVELLTVLDNSKDVAKLYPQAGLDSVVLNKAFAVKTDDRSYWNLYGQKDKAIKLSCELKHE